MTGSIIALLLLGLYWTLLYRGVSLAVFTGVTATVVVALAATGLIGPVGFVITALVLGLGLALFNIVPLRRRVPVEFEHPRLAKVVDDREGQDHCNRAAAGGARRSSYAQIAQ